MWMTNNLLGPSAQLQFRMTTGVSTRHGEPFMVGSSGATTALNPMIGSQNSAAVVEQDELEKPNENNAMYLME